MKLHRLGSVRFRRRTGERYLSGELGSPQHEAQRAASEHRDDRQRQQPVPLKEVPHGPLQVLLDGPQEEGLHSVPHGGFPSLSRDIRTVFGA